ncbi:MAG TPA: hypothetical protein VL332_10220 [Candidatus Saccharimonadaceae bacterium]|jgi:hypothetical protein|nr:hypothetical protein [Candidatus Saccharimonadaceae bacterium]
MRSVLRYLVLSFLLLSLTPRLLHSETHAYIGGGFSGAFRSREAGSGGWGIGFGLEHRIAKPAGFVAELSVEQVPAIEAGITPAWAAGDVVSGLRVRDPALRIAAAWAGVRVRGGGRGPKSYLDLLTGISNVQQTSTTYTGRAIQDEINGGLSVGAGFESPRLGRAAIFADAHYQFFFSGDGMPVVPIRVGLISR